MENVLFVPELKTNLFSVSKATNGGRTITFNETGAETRNNKSEVVFQGKRKSELYFIEINDVSECEASTEINQLKRWHQSMAVSSTESTQENEDHSRAGTQKMELSELKK